MESGLAYEQEAKDIVDRSRELNEIRPMIYSKSLFWDRQDQNYIRALSDATRNTTVVINGKKTYYNSFLHSETAVGKYDAKLEQTNILFESSADAFNGVVISCLDPSEIEEVALLFCPLSSKKVVASTELFVVKYVCNPTSPYIQFFDFPLLLSVGQTWMVSVKMASPFRKKLAVKLEFLSLTSNNL